MLGVSFRSPLVERFACPVAAERVAAPRRVVLRVRDADFRFARPRTDFFPTVVGIVVAYLVVAGVAGRTPHHPDQKKTRKELRRH